MKTAVFIYETAHVAALGEFLKKLQPSEAYDIIAYGADIEFLLEEKGIEYISIRQLRTISTPDRLIYVKKLGEKILNDDSFLFFSYRQISLAKLYVPALQYYLARLTYHLDIVATLFKDPYVRVILPAPTSNPGSTAAILERFNTWALPDTVTLICKEKKIPIEFIESKVRKLQYTQKIRQSIFTLQRVIFGTVLEVFNLFVRLFSPRKKIRILGSELWKNIAPLMSELPESELILLDRAESLKIGWESIMKNRMQFMQPRYFINRVAKKEIKNTLDKFSSEFRNTYERGCVVGVEYCGYSLDSIINKILNHIVSKGAERTLIEIEGSWRMIGHVRPDVVLVRAGISAQTHFAALCEVARLHKIPSIEIQHGIFSVFEGDYGKNPSSEYIAEYGPLVRTQLEEHAYAPRSHFIDIGSPRFDAYVQQPTPEKSSNKNFEILHVGPQLSPGEWNDTYDVYDYFETMASAAKNLSNIHITIKLRGGYVGNSFFKEVIQKTFRGLNYTVAITESLVDLLAYSDVVVTAHSTAYLEALLARRPLIVDASLPIYAALSHADLSPPLEAGALIIVETPSALKDALTRLIFDKKECSALSIRAEEFIHKNYLISDGQSSKRLAQAIRALAEKHGIRNK